MDAMTWLTMGLLIFAGVQVWVQVRSEIQRRRERESEHVAAIDHAFQLVWAEHFRLDALAEFLGKADLIEYALLGVLRPSDVLPRNWVKITEALATLSTEAAYLGGVALTVGYDLERAIGVYVGSVTAFSQDASGMNPGDLVRWMRQFHGPELKPWEESVRNGAKQLALLFLDAAGHNPRMTVQRQLHFSDTMESDFAKDAAKALAKRSTELNVAQKRPSQN